MNYHLFLLFTKKNSNKHTLSIILATCPNFVRPSGNILKYMKFYMKNMKL